LDIFGNCDEVGDIKNLKEAITKMEKVEKKIESFRFALKNFPKQSKFWAWLKVNILIYDCRGVSDEVYHLIGLLINLDEKEVE
jgi:hypothetical protein